MKIGPTFLSYRVIHVKMIKMKLKHHFCEHPTDQMCSALNTLFLALNDRILNLFRPIIIKGHFNQNDVKLKYL